MTPPEALLVGLGLRGVFGWSAVGGGVLLALLTVVAMRKCPERPCYQCRREATLCVFVAVALLMVGAIILK